MWKIRFSTAKRKMEPGERSLGTSREEEREGGRSWSLEERRKIEAKVKPGC